MKKYVDEETLSTQLNEKANQTDLDTAKSQIETNTNAIGTLKSENWTFTLEDGTTVVKEVVVK